jgi:hypothetical protein
MDPGNVAERRSGFRLKRKVVADYILHDIRTPADGEPRVD